MTDKLAERPWQIAIAFLSGAAGLGLFLVGLGAAVMWVRLDAVGLPAERGVGLISKQTLAVVGFHVLIEPVLLQMSLFAVVVLALVMIDARLDRRDADIDEVSDMQRSGSSRFNDRLFDLRTIAGLSLVALLFLPFEWGGVAIALVIPVMLLIVGELRTRILDDEFAEWMVPTLIAVVLLGPSIIGLAGEADKPSYLQLATIRLKHEGERSGYFVSEDADNVYLGVHEAIVSYPHEALRSVTVRPSVRLKPLHGPKPLAWRLFDLVFG